MLTMAPELAYGPAAVGPIPANSALQFEVELLSIAAPADEASSFAAFNEAPRTPSEISAAYQQKMAAKASPLAGLEGARSLSLQMLEMLVVAGLAERGPPATRNPTYTLAVSI